MLKNRPSESIVMTKFWDWRFRFYYVKKLYNAAATTPNPNPDAAATTRPPTCSLLPATCRLPLTRYNARLVELGFAVLQVDTDTVWTHDPFPMLRAMNRSSIICMKDVGLANAGIVYARPGSASISNPSPGRSPRPRPRPSPSPSPSASISNPSPINSPIPNQAAPRRCGSSTTWRGACNFSRTTPKSWGICSLGVARRTMRIRMIRRSSTMRLYRR